MPHYKTPENELHWLDSADNEHLLPAGCVEISQTEVDALIAAAIQVSVPQSVSALQGLLAVDQAGMAAAYTAWASDSARTFAERAFIDKAQTWKRDDPTLMAAAVAFGLTSTQIDSLFTLADSL